MEARFPTHFELKTAVRARHARRAVFDRLRDVNTEKSIKPPARRANQFSSSFATVSYSAGVIATSVLVRIADQGSDIAPCLTTAIAGR